MSDVDKYTTIRVSIATHRRLQALCRKGETYDELIRRLLNKRG